VLLLVEGINKLEDTEIIELTCSQVFNLVKNSGLSEHAILVKKHNIDGFSLVCTLSDFDTLRDIRNYFRKEHISAIL